MSKVLVHATPWMEKTDASASVNFPIHASARAGDIVLVGWTWNSSTLPGQASGWTMLDQQGSTGDTLAPSCSLHTKTITGTDVTNGYVTMAVHTSVGSGAAIVLQGYLSTPDFTLVPLDKTATSASFSFTKPASSPDACVIYLVGQNTVQADVFTPPTGYTEIGDRVSGRNATMGYKVYPEAAASATVTATSGATTRGVGIMAGYKPTDNPRFLQLM